MHTHFCPTLISSKIYFSFTIDNADCSVRLHNTYGLTYTESKKCCKVKQEKGLGKCGESEGQCLNDHDCQRGHTCGFYSKWRKNVFQNFSKFNI